MRHLARRDSAVLSGSHRGHGVRSRRFVGTREFLRAGRRVSWGAALGCVLLATQLGAAEDPVRESAVHIARLHYEGGGDWYSNPSSMPNWMRGFQERTGILTVSEEVQIRPDDDDLYRYPIAYMNGHGNVKFSDEDVRALRGWIAAGGFLWADDNYGMDASFRREVKKIFPDKEMFELPNDHPIFRCYYQLPGLPKIHEHDGKPPQLFGVVDKGRLLLVYSYQSDIGDGLEDPEVHKDSPEKREQALRMAVNILWYAMTH